MARRKTRKKKNNNRMIFLILLIIFAFSISQLGFVGRLAANLVRFFVGDLHLLVSLAFAGLSAYGLFVGALPKVKNHTRFWGILLVFLGLLIFIHALLFRGVASSTVNPLSLTWEFYLTDLLSNTVGDQLGGGMVGALLYSMFYFLFDQIGTYIVSVLIIFFGLLFIFDISFASFLTWLVGGIKAIVAGVAQVFDQIQASFESSKESNDRSSVPSDSKKEIRETQPVSEQEERSEPQARKAKEVPIESHSQLTQAPKTPAPQKQAEESEDTEVSDDFQGVAVQENEDYRLPPMILLNEVKATDQSGEYDTIENNIQKLEDTFESFGVEAKVVKANLGPAVTKYEIQPATGVKVSKIVNLQDDIALALAAKDIRIEAPIPGRALIGIEVPNQDISFVSFRETMELTKRDPQHLLEVPLGKDVAGNIQVADLAKMPHTLIAGSTGSGKSVAINAIITSILMRTKPSEVKLMMIDPKMVELNGYNGIPHLLTPVVTNPKKAARALNNVVKEMERRYELFASTGTKNRATYNAYVVDHNLKEGAELPQLPYIVVIVDELADLMMVASKEVEDAIMRLAQMARAAGIHMILATQRPSVDVLTGTIKANVPSRIAFAVSSGTDSRTILDSTGAEKLLGKGDMLYLPMGVNQPIRVQGTFISDQEVENVVNFVKDQQEVSYVEEMIPGEEAEQDIDSEPEDEYFEEAVAFVIDQESASVSMLQRRFRIGYNRAARLVDDMEARGIIGPANGSKPREVLIEKPAMEEELPSDQIDKES